MKNRERGCYLERSRKICLEISCRYGCEFYLRAGLLESSDMKSNQMRGAQSIQELRPQIAVSRFMGSNPPLFFFERFCR